MDRLKKTAITEKYFGTSAGRRQENKRSSGIIIFDKEKDILIIHLSSLILLNFPLTI
jgi:hypothetical protein